MSTLFRQHEMASPEGPSDSGYRPLSKAAIASPFVSAASLLAFLHPWYWILPPAAAAISLVAVWATSPRQEKSGRWLAVPGLALAAFVGVCAPARYLIVDWSFRSEAVAFAENWLDLVRHGRLAQAHQWMKPAGERYPEESALEELYAAIAAEHPDLPVAEEFAAFQQTPAPEIAGWGPEADIRLEEYASASGGLGDSRRAEMVFSVHPPEQGEPLRIRLLVERHYDAYTMRGEWRVAGFERE